MKFVLSGEGPSDIGKTPPTVEPCECAAKTFTRGPMFHFIETIVTDKLKEIRKERDEPIFLFVSERTLSSKQKETPLRLSGKKSGYGTALYFKNAKTLAIIAKEEQEQCSEKVGAILFRDCDGTNSSENEDFEKKVESMRSGFRSENFPYGVPMVPKPKSEAWLLCALKNNYQNCKSLEDKLSGNDASPNSAKRQLVDELAKRGKTNSDVAGMVTDGTDKKTDTIQPLRIDMPSFNEFSERLREIVHSMAS